MGAPLIAWRGICDHSGMIFRQLFDSVSSTYTYLLASRKGGEALIIDPVLEKVDRYIQLLNELDLRLVKAVDTHMHADHITGVGALRDRTHCITVMGEQTKADIVLGLDMNLAAEAKAANLFAPHGQTLGGLSLPVAWSDDQLIPFDWGHLAFVYDSTKLKSPPTSLRDLVDNPNGPKIVLQDPRTSAPGLGFLLWMQSVYGDKAGDACDHAQAIRCTHWSPSRRHRYPMPGWRCSGSPVRARTA